MSEDQTQDNTVYECEGCVHGEHDTNCLAGQLEILADWIAGNA